MNEDKPSLPNLDRNRARLRRGGKLSPPKRKMKRTRHGLAESRWSREVRERDNYTCQFPDCFKSYPSIDTHHIAPRSLRPDKKFLLENGVALCRPHHQHVHRNKDEAIGLGLLNLETYELARKQKEKVASVTSQEALDFMRWIMYWWLWVMMAISASASILFLRFVFKDRDWWLLTIVAGYAFVFGFCLWVKMTTEN